MNFTVNGVRYRSHNGVFPVKRRFGADAVLVHLQSSAETNKTVLYQHNTQHSLQSLQTTKQQLTTKKNNDTISSTNG